MNHYYVYMIRHWQSGEIVYVGKGKLERAYRQIFNVNGKQQMEKFYETGGDPASLLDFHSHRLTEKEAYESERELIHKFKQEGKHLENKMAYAPHQKTEEWKRKIKESNARKFLNRDNSDRSEDSHPQSVKCVYVPTGEIYGSLKRLCRENGINYSSARSYFHQQSKNSKYQNLIKKL